MTDANLAQVNPRNEQKGAVATARTVRELRPRVDLYENAEELLMLADMPGATANSVNIRIDNAQLTLMAEREIASGHYVRYHRAFQVPDTVDPEKIAAELKEGVLRVHLHKTERAKPRTISIKSS